MSHDQKKSDQRITEYRIRQTYFAYYKNRLIVII